MGTRFELVLGEPGGDPGGDARLLAVGEAAIEVIEAWHRRLSRFSPDSLVSHLNRTAAVRPVALDPGTFALLRDALSVSSASGGAFDVTGGAGGVELDHGRRTLRFQNPAARLDLGGIAKGHALDHAAAVLRANGVTRALLHGGTSSVVAIGAPPEQDGWQVVIGAEAGAPTLSLRDAALAVSSASPEGNEGHIRDPRTGAVVSGGGRAVVVGPSGRLADAWATAGAVLQARPPGCGPEWSFHLY